MEGFTNRLLTLVNSFSPHDLREVCVSALKELLMLWPNEMLSILVPLLHRYHSAHSVAASAAATAEAGEYAASAAATTLGAYFPVRNRRNLAKRSNSPRAVFQMFVPTCMLEAHYGQGRCH